MYCSVKSCVSTRAPTFNIQPAGEANQSTIVLVASIFALSLFQSFDCWFNFTFFRMTSYVLVWNVNKPGIFSNYKPSNTLAKQNFQCPLAGNTQNDWEIAKFASSFQVSQIGFESEWWWCAATKPNGSMMRWCLLVAETRWKEEHELYSAILTISFIKSKWILYISNTEAPCLVLGVRNPLCWEDSFHRGRHCIDLWNLGNGAG